MVIQRVKDDIETAFVLADSWFRCDTFMSDIHEIQIRYAEKIHVSGLLKTNGYIIIKGKNKMANLVPDYKR